MSKKYYITRQEGAKTYSWWDIKPAYVHNANWVSTEPALFWLTAAEHEALTGTFMPGGPNSIMEFDGVELKGLGKMNILKNLRI